MDDSVPFPPDVNRGGEILVVCGTLVGLSVAVVILRVWVRAKLVRLVGLDDYFMIAATVRSLIRLVVEGAGQVWRRSKLRKTCLSRLRFSQK